MGRVHDVLRWANRREVAREVTRRGYRVSGETLNLWVREQKEFPAVVERIVFDLFGITPDTQKEAPPWAEPLIADVDAIRRGVESEAIGLAALRAVLEAIQAQLPLPDVDPLDDPAPAPRAGRRGR